MDKVNQGMLQSHDLGLWGRGVPEHRERRLWEMPRDCSYGEMGQHSSKQNQGFVCSVLYSDLELKPSLERW